MSPVPPNRRLPTAFGGSGCNRYPSPALGSPPVQTIGPGWIPSEDGLQIDQFHRLVLLKKIMNTPDTVCVPLSLS